jgi:hypothetical protein
LFPAVARERRPFWRLEEALLGLLQTLGRCNLGSGDRVWGVEESVSAGILMREEAVLAWEDPKKEMEAKARRRTACGCS